MKLYSDKTIEKIMEILVQECDEDTKARLKVRFKEMDAETKLTE